LLRLHLPNDVFEFADSKFEIGWIGWRGGGWSGHGGSGCR
jgi:hypothetical protein